MNIPLAVLAGGEGSRMGRPKGELRIGNQPILKYLLNQWNWTGPTLLVTAPARQHPPGWELFDREVCDQVSGEGPLRGMITGLENSADAQMSVITTCDMPLVTRAMLDHGINVLRNDPDALGVMMRHHDAIEPFPLAVRPGVLPLLRQRLGDDLRSLRSLASLPQFRLIEAPAQWPDQVWTNLNSPGDYRAFLATLQ